MRNVNCKRVTSTETLERGLREDLLERLVVVDFKGFCSAKIGWLVFHANLGLLF